MSLVALVTGSSSGIGLATAVQLAEQGCTAVGTVRSPDRADRLRQAAQSAGVEVHVELLDVTDESSVRHCVHQVEQRFGSVDVLVNNAGRGMVASLEQLTRQDLLDQLDVNYLGVAAMTKAVLPGMRARRSGRIVTVTSVGGVVGQPFADAYCGAKFAVEGLMQSLAPVLARFGIEVSVVEPAAVASDFVGNVDRSDRSEAADPHDPYGPLLAAYLDRTVGAFASAQAPEAAAAVVVQAALTREPRFRWQTSDAAKQFVGLSLADHDGDRVLGYTATWLA